MEIALVVIFAVLGACIGSFINVCVDRLPAGKSLLAPPSHCDGCQQSLSWFELVPVFSYLWLRGRCRRCGSKVPLRVLLVELGCGLFLALLVWYRGLNLDFAVIAFYSFVFVVIGLIDLQTKLILNKIVYPIAVVAIVLDIFLPQPGFFSGLLGGVVGFVFFLIPIIVTRGGMGFGDVKMAALIGLVTGFSLVWVAILGGVIAGGLVAIFLLVSGLKKRKESIPFGPFLSLAAMAALLWGHPILNWYLGLFGR
jgi:leader peptidase (prepilin peptidase) / N-methyltransferase